MRYIILLILPLFLFSKDIYFEGGKINLEDLAITVSLETGEDIVLHQSLKDRVVFMRVSKIISTKKLFLYFSNLLEANGLALNKKEGFYIVSPVTDLKYYSYRFNHRNTKDFEVHIDNYKEVCTIGSKMLYCNATPKAVDILKKMVKAYDIPLPLDIYKNKTVDIKVTILESGYNDLLTLKNELALKATSKPLHVDSSAIDGLSLALDMFLNGTSIANTLSLSYFFEYLEQNDISKVINEPRVLVTNKHKTSITTGGTTRVISSKTQNDDLSAETTSYEQFDIGLQISIEAEIINDTKCKLTIMLNNENVIGGTSELPVTSKQSYETTLTIDKNQTIIIGGVIYERDTKSLSKIPILGDIPILGIPFKNEENIKEKKVLTIALTIKDFN